MKLLPKIIFEDSDFIVIDKPAGMIVNRADTSRGAYTVQDWVESKIELNAGGGFSEFESRGGIVHRLDKETSGVLLIAKNESTFVSSQEQFKNRTVKKKYIALVHGVTPDRGTVNATLGRVGRFGKFGIDESGRESSTDYGRIKHHELTDEKIDDLLLINELKLNKNRKNYLKTHAKLYSYLEVFPLTGRTHQIRVHLKSIGFPLVSDLIYSPAKLLKFDLLWCPRLFLHAQRLEMNHPGTGEKCVFEANLPRDLSEALGELN